MSENQDKSIKAKHTLKKMKASEQIHSQLTKEKDPNEKQLPIILTNEDSTAIQIEDKESKDLVHLYDFSKIPEKPAKLIISFLGVTSLDSTNICSVFPVLKTYRSAVLTDYYASISSQYSSNRDTGFLSPDHCRTPVLSKPEESIYSDLQMLRSHRRLHFDD